MASSGLARFCAAVVVGCVAHAPLAAAQNTARIPLRGVLERQCTIAVSAEARSGLLIGVTGPLLGARQRLRTLISISCNFPGASLLDLLSSNLGIQAGLLANVRLNLLHLLHLKGETRATFELVSEPLLPLTGHGTLITDARANVGQVLTAVVTPN